jgi:hypothetical protein
LLLLLSLPAMPAKLLLLPPPPLEIKLLVLALPPPAMGDHTHTHDSRKLARGSIIVQKVD